jgi:hypothetical protein
MLAFQEPTQLLSYSVVCTGCQKIHSLKPETLRFGWKAVRSI